jgi:hypothetical protein
MINYHPLALNLDRRHIEQLHKQIDIDSKIIIKKHMKIYLFIFIQRFESFLNVVHAFVEEYQVEIQVD